MCVGVIDKICRDFKRIDRKTLVECGSETSCRVHAMGLIWRRQDDSEKISMLELDSWLHFAPVLGVPPPNARQLCLVTVMGQGQGSSELYCSENWEHIHGISKVFNLPAGCGLMKLNINEDHLQAGTSEICLTSLAWVWLAIISCGRMAT